MPTTGSSLGYFPRLPTLMPWPGPQVTLCNRKAVELESVAGAYWRGDEKKQMLQRIYGTAWENEEQLKAYLHFKEEAKRGDHRRLGQDLDPFSIQDEAGGGLVFWHPKGAIVRHIIEDSWKKIHIEHDYDLLYTPHVARADLWKTSGHLDFYRENIKYEVNLSTRPEKAVGADDIWEKAISALRDALDDKGWSYRIDEGGGAFYGPKIDLKIEDALGRKWQCSTIPVDFPLWLPPIQARVLPVTDTHSIWGGGKVGVVAWQLEVVEAVFGDGGRVGQSLEGVKFGGRGVKGLNL
ncbi:threonine--tRNA ligase, chloroplastic/mitochondrial 2-like [Vitis riparia]|uniref:threonine--tRNA ligase, chloroplastic/mitochondrial 2-like n=1 Tax=Vitis riparia TaxID=96939 RepID=UPI00155AAC72|nr:threonine--tRNA ligase, chloroplastic/mitochondrial 2-like [Vitis riparia]